MPAPLTEPGLPRYPAILSRIPPSWSCSGRRTRLRLPPGFWVLLARAAINMGNAAVTAVPVAFESPADLAADRIQGVATELFGQNYQKFQP